MPRARHKGNADVCRRELPHTIFVKHTIVYIHFGEDHIIKWP